ncbi:hypothetical protein LWC34_31650 [Kibdelosporangium philippinense]|uniref:Uncharacterized protein n=1 Tax=Kibdelosporangium philippinense TaxID=211113 RepID=A0ABS8ZIK1_9PSEU|nr:hypothetical protein [Kibdelosporangium philippinense]MCE7007342.1 hypothetical protein [Kibdelosporangium philippinense]
MNDQGWTLPGQEPSFYLEMHAVTGAARGQLGMVTLINGDELFIDGSTVAALMFETVSFRLFSGPLRSVVLLVCDAAALGMETGLAFDIWAAMRVRYPELVLFASTSVLDTWHVDLHGNGAPATEIEHGGKWVGFGAPAAGENPSLHDILDQLRVWQGKNPQLRAHYAATIPLFAMTDRVAKAVAVMAGRLRHDRVLDLLSAREILESGLGDPDLVKIAVLRVLRDTQMLPEPAEVILAELDPVTSQLDEFHLPAKALSMLELGQQYWDENMRVRTTAGWAGPDPSPGIRDYLEQHGVLAALTEAGFDHRSSAHLVDMVNDELAVRGIQAAQASAANLGSALALLRQHGLPGRTDLVGRVSRMLADGNGNAATAHLTTVRTSLSHHGVDDSGAQWWFDAGQVRWQSVRDGNGPIAVTFVRDGQLRRFLDEGGVPGIEDASIYDAYTDARGVEVTVEGKRLSVSLQVFMDLLVRLGLVTNGRAMLLASYAGLGDVEDLSRTVRTRFPRFELSAPRGRVGFGTVVNREGRRRQTIRVLDGGSWVTVDMRGLHRFSAGVLQEDGPEWTPQAGAWAVRGS